jgi:cysteine desulfurase
MQNRVYADYCATAPVSPAHYDQVVEALKKVDGNPSSIHSHGREAKVALENCRADVAALLGVDDQEIIFTSGATEANNLVIQGIVGQSKSNLTLPRIIVTATEHPSILATAKLLHERGQCEVVVIPVDRQGYVDEAALLGAINLSTVLVSVIHVNNEVGTIQDVRTISAKVKAVKSDLHFHTDSVQALGKLDLTGIGGSTIDSVAISSHKVGGLKGMGALFLRRGKKLNVLISGGGQERSRRAGTENMPGIVSFGMRAVDLRKHADWLAHCPEIYRKLLGQLVADERVKIHGDTERGIFSTINFHVEGVRGEDILLNFDLAGIAVSSGSACSSGANRPSPILMAMGYGEWEALNSIRVSFGSQSKLSDVDKIMSVLNAVMKRRR